MSQSFDISEELLLYFKNQATRRAVNHVVSSAKSSNWMDLSQQDLDSDSKAFDGYEKYATAWLYSKKVQADFYTLISHLWRETWGGVFSDKNLAKAISFTNFNTVKDTWHENGWNQTIQLKPSTKASYPYVWTGIYIDLNSFSASNIKVIAWLQFGREDDSTYCKDVSEKHAVPNEWKLTCDDDQDVPDFRASFNLSKQSDTPLLSDIPKNLFSDIPRFMKEALKI